MNEAAKGKACLQKAGGHKGVDAFDTAIITQLEEYIHMGWGLIPLPKGSKGPPKFSGWKTRQIRSIEDAKPYILEGSNWAVATGEPSGVVVVDFDTYKSAEVREKLMEWEADHGGFETRTHKSASDGFHFFFRYTPEMALLKNKAGALAGVDIRTSGGYVVVPPSGFEAGVYRLKGDIKKPASMPSWMVEELRAAGYFKQERQEPKAKPIKREATGSEAHVSDYMITATTKEIERFQKEACAEGNRNDALNDSLFRLGTLFGRVKLMGYNGLVDAHVLDTTQKFVLEAQRVGLEDGEIKATIQSGLTSGLQKPRDEIELNEAEKSPEKSPKKTWKPSRIQKWLKEKGYLFELNLMDDTIHVTGAGFKNSPMTDPMASIIRTSAREVGITDMRAVEDCYVVMAQEHAFHPVHRYLEGLQYNGEVIEDFAKAYILTTHEGLPQEWVGRFLKRWLVGAVNRAYTGRQNFVIVLEGKQGIGKSRFAKWVCPSVPTDPKGRKSLFVESPISPDNKDFELRMAATFVWEICELGSTTNKAHRESLKAFLTKEQIDVRKAYGKHFTHKPALSSFIATVNNQNGFLNDPTGSRRFVTLPVDSIVMNALTTYAPDELWAEAYHLFQMGESPFMTPEEEQMAQSLNSTFQTESPALPYLLEYFEFTHNEKDYIPTVKLVGYLRTLGPEGCEYATKNEKQTQWDISDALASLGCPSKKKKHERGYTGLRLKAEYYIYDTPSSKR